MLEMFGTRSSNLHVVPNGVEEIFFKNSPSTIHHPKSPWLVCTATITERKRVLELAEAAVLSKTPVWIIGKPYTEKDPYYLRFLEVVSKSEGDLRYEGGISDRSQMADIYKGARGFVLLSTMESRSLSSEEAAAAGCPLLLSDLQWARCTFESNATYCPITNKTEATAQTLKSFHIQAPNLPIPSKPKTWNDVALQLKGIYEELLNEKG